MKRIFYYLLPAFIVISFLPVNGNAALILPGGEPDPAVIKSAMAEFKSLSKKEKKTRIKEVKKQVKLLKKEKKENQTANVEMWVLILLSILLPPLAVYLHYGQINGRFWLSILLTLLFWIPGVIYAILVVTDSI